MGDGCPATGCSAAVVRRSGRHDGEHSAGPKSVHARYPAWLYDPAERPDPLPCTGDDTETDSDSEDAGSKCEYVRYSADDYARKTYTVSGTTDADAGDGETASEQTGGGCG